MNNNKTIKEIQEAFRIQKILESKTTIEKKEMYKTLIKAGIICDNDECTSKDCSKTCFN